MKLAIAGRAVVAAALVLAALAATSPAAAVPAAAPVATPCLTPAEGPGLRAAQARSRMAAAVRDLQRHGWTLTTLGRQLATATRPLPGEAGASGELAVDLGQVLLATSDTPLASRALQRRGRATGSVYRGLPCTWTQQGNVIYSSGSGSSRVVWNETAIWGEPFLYPGPSQNCQKPSCTYFAWDGTNADFRVTGFTATATIGPVLTDYWCSWP